MANVDIQTAVQDTYGAIARAKGAVSCCRPADPSTSQFPIKR